MTLQTTVSRAGSAQPTNRPTEPSFDSFKNQKAKERERETKEVQCSRRFPRIVNRSTEEKSCSHVRFLVFVKAAFDSL
jgi:hypothetical protein